MASEPTERRRRRTDPTRPVDEPAGAHPRAGGPGGDGSGVVTADEGSRRDAGPRPDFVPVPSPVPGNGVSTDGAAPEPGAAAPRPLSRRELRERERRAVADARSAGEASSHPASTAVVGERVPRRPDGPDLGVVETTAAMTDTVPSDRSRYRLVHYLALALVACVLGYLIWSLTTGAAEPGASSAALAVSITSPSALQTVTQGEL
jgi:hypothetical protein